MSARLDPLVRFGTFKLDLRTGELRRSGVSVNLPEQPLQVLKPPLERSVELGTLQELRQRLWSAETFVDFEHGLNAAVRRLRDALGDSAETPRFVETLPRRGYRFIAPLIQEPAADSMPPSASISALQPLAAPAKAASPRRARFVTVAAVAATALVAAGLWSGRAAGVSGLSGQRLVTDYRGSHGWGSFSPDGKMIAYTSDADGSDQVWVKNLAAGDPIQLTFGPPGVGRLAWAPAGDQIVFAKAGGRGIWSVPPLGGPPRRLLEQGNRPKFSRNGRRLVFERAGEIWIANADGSDSRRVYEPGPSSL